MPLAPSAIATYAPPSASTRDEPSNVVEPRYNRSGCAVERSSPLSCARAAPATSSETTNKTALPLGERLIAAGGDLRIPECDLRARVMGRQPQRDATVADVDIR